MLLLTTFRLIHLTLLWFRCFGWCGSDESKVQPSCLYLYFLLYMSAYVVCSTMYCLPFLCLFIEIKAKVNIVEKTKN